MVLMFEFLGRWPSHQLSETFRVSRECIYMPGVAAKKMLLPGEPTVWLRWVVLNI
jgi:hypothetical protein